MAFSIKHTSKQFLSKGLFIGGCMVLGYASANEAAPAPIMLMPSTPGFSAYGFAGNGWTAYGDIMAPLAGQPLNFFYVDPQIYYHSDHQEITGAVGLGQRVLTHYGILGGYVFGDYDHSLDGNDYWFVSPGIERLGTRFDFSANLYIPVSTQKFDNGLEFADQVGDYSKINFSGHTQYDELVQTFESTGWGGDAQIGVRTPFRNSKVYFGTYFFDPKDNDSLVGGLIRAEVPINDHFSVVGSEAYDSKFHNTLKAGLTIWLGGRSTGYTFSGNLAERMVDPVQRGAAGIAGGGHNLQAIVQGSQDTNQIAVEKTNISFFVPNKSATDGDAPVGDGTYENPYRGMTQSNVDDANGQNNRNFYINSGTYNAVYGSVNPDFIVLNNDQLYGRTNNFRQTASGSSRPLIKFDQGGFLVPAGDSNDGFNDLQLTGTNANGSAGIYVDHESGKNLTVNINDLSVKNFGDGIDIYNTNNAQVSVNIFKSQILDNSGGGVAPFQTVNGGYGGGVVVFNDGGGKVNLSIDRSTIANNSNGSGENAVANWGGVTVFNNDTGSTHLRISRSTLSGNSSGSSVSGAILLDNESSGQISAVIDKTNVVNNSIDGINLLSDLYNKNATGSVDLSVDHSNLSGDSGAGLNANIQGNATDINVGVEDSVISGNKGTGISFNIESTADVFLNVDQTRINDNTTDGLAFNNVLSSGNSVVNIKDSQLNHNGGNGINIVNFERNGSEQFNIIDSTMNSNSESGINISNNASADLTVKLKKDTLNNNGFSGINFSGNSDQDNTLLDLSEVTISHNKDFGININYSVSSGSFELIMNKSFISDNEVDGISLVSNTNSGTITAKIDNSVITGNKSSGILFENNCRDVVNCSASLTIDHSRITHNAYGVNISSNASDSGVANTVATISHSFIGFNSQAGVSNSSQNSGLVGNVYTNLTIDHTNIVGNGVGVLSNASNDAEGGNNDTTILIEKSAIIFNDTGVSVNTTNDSAAGSASTGVIIDQSIVAHNNLALSSVGPSIINVTNPIYFNGVVNYSDGGQIIFPSNIQPNQPNSGDTVICTWDNGCFVQ
ncbi:MAG: inverse autotransporter beta domain-containing protein [Proteobacteria bacterium]|nr:inverse autotransporter beta domain-containing protein [Pseudomonadota bacterium]